MIEVCLTEAMGACYAHGSGTGIPGAARLSASLIWLSVNFDLFMQNIPPKIYFYDLWFSERIVEGLERRQIQALLSGLMVEVGCVGNLPSIGILSIRNLIFSMACEGSRPLGHTSEQFMMVRQRNRR